MSGEAAHGAKGEAMVALLLEYEGWTDLRPHPLVLGHRLDFEATDPEGVEWLVEVKVWRNPRAVGTDNIKKAIADAYDLRAGGETRPYLLVLSHHPSPLHHEMLARAITAGAIAQVRVVGFVPYGVEG